MGPIESSAWNVLLLFITSVGGVGNLGLMIHRYRSRQSWVFHYLIGCCCLGFAGGMLFGIFGWN